MASSVVCCAVLCWVYAVHRLYYYHCNWYGAVYTVGVCTQSVFFTLIKGVVYVRSYSHTTQIHILIRSSMKLVCIIFGAADWKFTYSHQAGLELWGKVPISKQNLKNIVVYIHSSSVGNFLMSFHNGIWLSFTELNTMTNINNDQSNNGKLFVWSRNQSKLPMYLSHFI